MRLYYYNRARTHLWQGSNSSTSCNHDGIPGRLLLVKLPQAVHLGAAQVCCASLMLPALTGAPQRSACMALDEASGIGHNALKVPTFVSRDG